MQLYGLRLVSILPMLAPMCTPVSSLAMWCPWGPGTAIFSWGGDLSTGRRARLVFKTRRRLGHRGLRFRRAGLRLQSRHAVYLGTAPRHIWLNRARLLCYGCRATATALPVVFVTVLLPTGSGSARSDGLCALTTNHPYGPSLVVGSYLVWDATRRELWETLFWVRPAGCQFVSIGRNDSHWGWRRLDDQDQWA